MRHYLILLLFLLTARLWAALPVLGALEEMERGRILAVEPGSGRLLLLEPTSVDSSSGLRVQVAAGPGGGPGSLERAAEADARLGLQILVLDGGRRRLQQFTRELTHQGGEALPDPQWLPRPDLLAVSEGRAVVVADSRAGVVAVRRPGEEWIALLDFSRVGRLRPHGLEVVGERVYLLETDPVGRLWLCGSEGGWWEAWTDSSLCALHRAPAGGLLLLREKGQTLELELWPEAARLSHLPDASRQLLARYPRPAEGRIRDFLLLDERAGGSRLLLSRDGAPALLLDPLGTAP
jgi:hypothetical protein